MVLCAPQTAAKHRPKKANRVLLSLAFRDSPAINKKPFKSQGSAKGSNMIILTYIDYTQQKLNGNELYRSGSEPHDPVAFSCKVGMTSYLVISGA